MSKHRKPKFEAADHAALKKRLAVTAYLAPFALVSVFAHGTEPSAPRIDPEPTIHLLDPPHFPTPTAVLNEAPRYSHVWRLPDITTEKP